MPKFQKKPPGEVERLKQAIQEIIEGNPVQTQLEIVEQLKPKGFDVSQATVSRYIRVELKMERQGEKGYIKPEKAKAEEKRNQLDILMNRYVKENIGEVRLAALRTEPGYAQLLDMHLQEAYRDVLLGTVVSSDTIVLMVRESEDGKEMLKRIGLGGEEEN